jgi:hypothetical protein
MTDELITPENLSVPLLKSLFEAAFMETSLDAVRCSPFFRPLEAVFNLLFFRSVPAPF